MDFFAKKLKAFSCELFSQKRSIVDIWLSSKYVSGINSETYLGLVRFIVYFELAYDTAC